jgi:DeoR family transcriptional regulator, fructose operon transcriptional repressor
VSAVVILRVRVDMFIEERLQKILDTVKREKRLSVRDASAFLQVSSDTIRRDFDRLSDQELVVRTHGGIVAQTSVSLESSFAEREVRFKAEKERIGLAAAELIQEHDTVILDAGTTTFEIIPHLSRFQDLTVLTNTLNIASELMKIPQLKVIVFGGLVRHETLAIVGPDAEEMCRNYHADKLFLSVSAVSLDKGLMNPNRSESEVKRSLIKTANQVVVVTDSSKINKTALFSFGDIDCVSTFVTDPNADTAFVKELHARGVQVILA